MTKIKHYTKQIKEELCGAKYYAEKYVEYKSRNDSTWANRYKEMANDELKHALYLHEKAVKEIEELEKTYHPTSEMQKKWDESHQYYVDKVAWIKQMLQM